MENAELSQHCPPVVVDFFSGQTIIAVERIHAAKRDLDSSSCRRKTTPLPEMRTANQNFHDNGVVRDMPALYIDFQVRESLHELLVKQTNPVAALIVFAPSLIVVPCTVAERFKNTCKVMRILKSNVSFNKCNTRRPRDFVPWN